MNQRAFQSVSPGNRFDDLPVLSFNGRFRPPASRGEQLFACSGRGRILTLQRERSGYPLGCC